MIGSEAVRISASPCTARTVRCADARDYNTELAECCREHVRKIMAGLIPMLEDARITYWADYGTLLGAVRNPMTTWADYPWLRQDGRETAGPAPGIIPHDKDGDLGVLFTDWGKYTRLRPKIEGVLRYYFRVNGGRASSKVRVSFRNHTNVDLFFWRERADGVMYRERYAQVDRFKGKEFPKSMLFPLTTVTWEGLTLAAPRDPEAFLEMRYGSGWRKPIAANNDSVKR